MTLWWPSLASPYCFPDQPWSTWFWAIRPGSDDDPFHPSEWPKGYYWFFKIPPSESHREQLAFRSPEDRKCPDYSRWGFEVKKDLIYITVYPGDTPNWGDFSTIHISTPCANWKSDVYVVPGVTRTQSVVMESAIQATRDLESSMVSAIAKTGLLELDMEAIVAGNFAIELDMDAAIRGDADRTFLARAAVRDERTLEESVVSAVATEFGDTVDIETAIQGNPFETVRIDAAILGETELEVTIKTTIVKDRTEAIMLELENTWPQEFYFVSIPNWRSRTKDYRTDSIG